MFWLSNYLQVQITKYLNSNDKKILALSFLYTKKYNKRSLQILEWYYYRKKRQKSHMKCRINNVFLHKSFYDHYQITQILPNVSKKWPEERAIKRSKLIYYFDQWCYHFYKFKERYVSSRYQIRYIKKRVYDDDTNFHTYKKLKIKHDY